MSQDDKEKPLLTGYRAVRVPVYEGIRSFEEKYKLGIFTDELERSLLEAYESKPKDLIEFLAYFIVDHVSMYDRGALEELMKKRHNQ